MDFLENMNFTKMKLGKVFRPFLKRSLLIVTAVFLDFGLKSSLDLLTAKQNIKYEHPTFFPIFGSHSAA